MHSQGDDSTLSGDSRALLGKLWSHVAPVLVNNRQRVVLALLFLLAAKAGLLVIPFLLKALVDGLDNPAEITGFHWLLMLVLAYGGARFANTLFAELRDTLFGRVTELSMRIINLRVFQHVHSLDLDYHLNRQTGGLARDIERGINGKTAAERVALRQERSAPLMADLHAWLTAQLAKLSRSHDLAKAIGYMLRRWDAFTRFLVDGRICITNNAAERALRCVPLGRKAWLFCGSDRGGQRAAVLYTLIQTARLNDVDPQAWLADVLARIAGHPAHRIDELLPWNWRANAGVLSQAA